MRTRPRRPRPPTDANALLADLRAARLLPLKKLRKLAIAWSESRPDEPDDPAEGTRLRARELVRDGLLTAWQVEQVLAGGARRLRLGQYRLLEWLGSGGMGTVYKAEHRLMKRVVALKVLRDADGAGDAALPGPQSPPAAARSRREVEAAARLSHPNIVVAYDAVRAGGVFFLVMEYVEGIDLGRLLTEAGPLPVPLACEAIRQAALALHYAHGSGLVHCDVKPSNLLLVHPPRPSWDAAALERLAAGPVTVKLLDMGLARRTNVRDSTAEHDLEGTPDYMAPERGSGEPIDGRSDLYSLGCTFYHLLTGEPPFPGGDGASKVLRHRLDGPPPVRGLRPEVPPDLADLVACLTARDPAGRFAAAADVAAALEAPAAGSSPRGRPGGETRTGVDTAPETPDPAPAAMPRRPAPRTAYRIWAALGLATVVCGLLAGAAVRWTMRPTAAAAPDPPPSFPAPAPLPFVIEGRAGGFASLAEAVAAADDGAVLTVRGTGPYRTPPLSWHGRRLTLRAAGDGRPCLELVGPAADPWLTLLATDADLTLEGLDLRSAGSGGRLVCCERGDLRLKDCRLTAPACAGLVHRGGAALSLEACRVETGGAAVSAEVGGKANYAVRIVGSTLDVRVPGGAALAVWAPAAGGATAVGMELAGDTLRADRAIALTALPGGVRVTASGDAFFFRDGVLSCAGYADREGWRRTTAWDGRENRYHGPGAWLTVDGVPADVRGLRAWGALWPGGETGSREDAPAGP